jgi:signal peptidase I
MMPALQSALQKGAFNMRQLRAWFITLGVALLIVIAVRTFVFAIYRVPAASVLRQGDRIMVNMLAHGDYKRGELVVFGKQMKRLGRIKAVPGDTIIVSKKQFVIPMVCCKKCRCEHCFAYLVNTGDGQTLVSYHDIIGPAMRLFYLPF